MGKSFPLVARQTFLGGCPRDFASCPRAWVKREDGLAKPSDGWLVVGGCGNNCMQAPAKHSKAMPAAVVQSNFWI